MKNNSFKYTSKVIRLKYKASVFIFFILWFVWWLCKMNIDIGIFFLIKNDLSYLPIHLIIL